VKLLLDTNALLSWLGDEERPLGPIASAAIADPQTIVYVSAVCAWEIAIKTAQGRLRVPDDLEAQLALVGFVELPVTVADGLVAGALPRHHADPFDRMLVAQAQRRALTIVTRDQSFAHYKVAVLYAQN